MSQNQRSSEVDTDTEPQRNNNHHRSEGDSTIVSALRRTEQEVMANHEVQQAIESILEPLIRGVIPQFEDGNFGNNNSPDEGSTMVSALRKVLELMVICTVHVIEPVMECLMRRIAKEVIESEVEKILTSKLQFLFRNSGNEIHSVETRSLLLRFQNKLFLPIWTGIPIKGEECKSIKVALVDGLTGEVINSGPEASAKVEIVVLQEEFNDEGHDWTHEEFNQKIVRDGKGNKSLLNGNAYLKLKEGIGSVREIFFTHQSSWTKNRGFRLGARIVGNFKGTRIREAKTEPFIIKDRRIKLYEKHDSPSLTDEVWRLKNIDRRGAFYKRLSKRNIETVQGFLTEFFLRPQGLRNILGNRMSAKMLEETVAHGLTCKLDDRYLYHSHSLEQKIGIVFNVVGQLLGVLYGGHYVPIYKLPEPEKAYPRKLLVNAFEHWGEVVSVDENSLCCDSSDLSNVLYSSNSPSLESPNGHDNETYHMMDGNDSTQPHMGIISSTHPSTSGHNNWGMIDTDDFVISDMDLLCASASPPSQVLSSHIFSPESMIQDFDKEHPQFLCNYRDSGMESHVDQQSAESGFVLAGPQAVVIDKAHRWWVRISIVLRFQQRIRIVKSHARKRQRRSY